MKNQGSSQGSGDGKWRYLSGEASRVAAILSASRLRRIEKIQGALTAGTYFVDGQLIAEKMVSDAVCRLRERMR